MKQLHCDKEKGIMQVFAHILPKLERMAMPSLMFARARLYYRGQNFANIFLTMATGVGRRSEVE